MQNNGPRISWYLDKRAASSRNAGAYPLKLRVTFKEGDHYRQTYYSTGHYFKKDREYKRLLESPTDQQQHEWRDQLQLMYNKAWRIIQTKRHITSSSFEQLFTGNTTQSLSDYFLLRIDQLKNEKRIGNAMAYQQALRSLEKHNRGPLPFTITPQWLTKYETWAQGQGLSITTIGITLRTLRAVLNHAIANGVISTEFYPFTNYRIRTERKLKRPLSEREINLLKGFTSTDYHQSRAVAMWLLSYYCNGMNTADLCQLTRQSLQGDFLTYNRAKTRLTKNTVQIIHIPLRAEIHDILNRYGSRNLAPNAYLLPVLEHKQTAETQKQLSKNFNRYCNQHLLKVAKQLGIAKLSMGLARHSFANRLLNSGISKEFIQYALGHNNITTTEHYVGTFALDKIKQVGGLL